MLFEKDLNFVLREIMQDWDMPGLAVGIVEKAAVVYLTHLGVQNVESQEPVKEDSIFCVQSISKCFVAMAVMQLVERGLIQLDSPIIEYLPSLKLDDHRLSQITVRQLLSHTSGIPDMDEIEYVNLVKQPAYDTGVIDRYLHSLQGRKLVAAPGERFSYSNIAYNILGAMLSTRLGKSFESIMEESIFLPAGMHSSTYRMDAVLKARTAWPHLRSPEMRPTPFFPYHRADAPASFLFTTIQDMCCWMMTCLQKGSIKSNNILLPKSFDLMWGAVVQRSAQRPRLYEQMALGWNLGHFQQECTISHGGGAFGWTAFLLLMPDRERAAVVLCNEESFAHIRIIQAVAAVMIGQKPHTGIVSGMIPISRSLAAGGIPAAHDCCCEMKNKQDEYYFDELGLIDLSLQLFTAGNSTLALDVLELNLSIFPEHIDSLLMLAKLYKEEGDMESAVSKLQQIMSIDPSHEPAMDLLHELNEYLE